MPGPKGVQLPKNLVEDKRFDDQTIYKTDYCFRRPPLPQRRRIGTKETPLHPKDFVCIILLPSSFCRVFIYAAF